MLYEAENVCAQPNASQVSASASASVTAMQNFKWPKGRKNNKNNIYTSCRAKAKLYPNRGNSKEQPQKMCKNLNKLRESKKQKAQNAHMREGTQKRKIKNKLKTKG